MTDLIDNITSLLAKNKSPAAPAAPTGDNMNL
jgi:hypothetical protein